MEAAAEAADVEVKMKKTIKINGMHCASCSKIIKMELKDKVNSISVSHETGQAVIDFDENKIKEEEIKEIITKLRYKVK